MLNFFFELGLNAYYKVMMYSNVFKRANIFYISIIKIQVVAKSD